MDENENKLDEEVEEEVESDAPIIATVSPDELQLLIDTRDRSGLIEVFERVPTIDIAEAANGFNPKDLIYIFRVIESSWTAEFFEELSQDTKEELIAAMTDRDLVRLINEQSADDVADTVDDMPANLAARVLKAADKEMRADVNALLNYKDGTAGSIMTTEYLQFPETMSVDDTIDAIREKGKDAETIYTIFVRNRKREFVGTVGLDDLIFAKKTEILRDVMNRDVVSVRTSTDQEEVGQMFRRYDLNALAVLNQDDRLVGVITIDDAVDVMTEESSEDIAHLTNVATAEKPYLEATAWENAKRCIPWLMILLVLGTFTTMVLNRLEGLPIFQQFAILIAFVPTLMDTGGNAGGQTTGMMIRGLALKEFTPKQTLKVLWKEFRSGLIVAAAVGAFCTLWILMEHYTGIVNVDAEGIAGATIWNGQCWSIEFFDYAIRNAGIVGITLFLAIALSKGIGTLLCMTAAALKKDPALLAQPLLTTIMDVTTLLVYFGVSTLLLVTFK